MKKNSIPPPPRPPAPARLRRPQPTFRQVRAVAIRALGPLPLGTQQYLMGLAAFEASRSS